MAAIILVLVLTVILPLIWWYKRLYNFKRIFDFPGPTVWPIIGNVTEFGSNMQDVFKNFLRLKKLYGGAYRAFMGPFSVNLVISEPTYIEAILNSSVHINKGQMYDCFRPWFGNSILICHAANWRLKRKIIGPSFNLRILEDFFKVFNAEGKILTKVIKEKCLLESYDIHPVINLHSVCILGDTFLGVNKLANKRQVYKNFLKDSEECFKIVTMRNFSLLQKSDLIFNLTSTSRRFTEAIDRIHKMSQSMIDMKRKEKGEGKMKNSNPACIVDVLIDLAEDKAITFEDIRNEVDGFMVAGQDTIASATSFTLFELAKHPELQQKIVDETNLILGTDKDADMTLQQVEQMTYLECVVKETMRMYTTAPVIERLLREDLLIDGKTIPSGTVITVLIYAMHEDEKLFPNPEKYDPDRFLPENRHLIQPYSYIPFSIGPRNCIGQRYAMLVMKSTIARILRNFMIIPVEPEHKLILSEPVIKAINGMPIITRIRS